MPRHDVFNIGALKAYFENVEFPCPRDELLQVARRHGASEPFMRALEELPKHNFQDVEEVHLFLNGELDMETVEGRNNNGRGPRH